MNEINEQSCRWFKNIKIVSVSFNDIDEYKLFVKFLADSGVTEHLTNSRIIFQTFNEADEGTIKCANKNSSADLRMEGARMIEIAVNDNSILELDNVTFITGVYNRSNWIVEFGISIGNLEENSVTNNNKRIFINLTTDETNDKNEPRYKTRSVAACEMLKHDEKLEADIRNVNKLYSKTITKDQIQVGINENPISDATEKIEENLSK